MTELRNVEDVYPLTPAQAGILYHHLANPGSQMYHEQVRFDLVGRLDLDVLRAAWCHLVERHPALRTSIVWDGVDDPVQVVRERVDLPWEVVDRRADPPSETDLDELAGRRLDAGLDLRRAPVMGLCLVRVDDARTHVVWDFHHLLVDGWSAALLIDEMLEAYEACRAGQTPELPAAPPFREHLAWLQRRDRTASERYWRERLSTRAGPFRLPVAHSAPATSYEAGRVERSLDRVTTDELVEIARSERVTVNTIVQAAWAILLARYGDDTDVVFGVTTSGRSPEISDVERIVGMFLNVVPFRCSVDEDAPVTTFLRDLFAAQLDSAEHEHLSLVDVQRAAGVPAGQALFDTVLIYENYPTARRDDRSIVVERHRVTERTNFPLALMVGVDETLEIVALHDATRLSAQATERIVSHLHNVLVEIASDPTRPIGDVELLDVHERRLVVEEWNRTEAPLPDVGSVGRMLAARADRSPDALAVIDGADEISLGELLARARRLGDRLAAAGVSPGDRVAVSIPRSIDMIVAVVGVIWVGAVYVPLDPEYPPARRRLIVDVARPKVVVVRDPDALDEASSWNVPVVSCVPDDEGGPPGSAEPYDAPPESPLFLTFTSGSTGGPKGVPAHHRGVLNRLEWQWRAFPFDPDEVGAAKTTLNFVDHVFEIWGHLLAGHPIAIIDESTVRDPELFVKALAHHDIRRVTLVPSQLSALLDAMPDLGGRLPRLRFVAASGESTSSALAERFRRAVPDAVLLNFYGMSEATQDATWYDDRWAVAADSFPIGRPIDNMRTYVLDRVGRPMPVGVPGEIHVGGVGLFCGYLDRPDLTAQQMRDDHLGGDGSLYRTGDLGRWLPSGHLEYLGRVDDQVKVRGHRVEPAEVEQVLREDHSVRDVVVVGREAGGSVQLVAYVVGTDVDVGALRELARRNLPTFMVPAHIVELDEFPRTPNGKVDRLALPAPTAGRRRSAEPTTPTESAMLSIWREQLGVVDIGLDDDFFETGGDSLSAVRLYSRIHRAFDNSLPLSTLFDAPTPRALAAVVDRIGREAAPTETPHFRHVVPIQPGPPDAGLPVFCVHGAGGNVLNLRDLAHEMRTSHPFYGLQARGIDGATPMHDSLDELCDDYGAEIDAVAGDAPMVLAGFSSGGLIALELAARRVARDLPVRMVVLLDTFHPAVTPGSTPWRDHARAVRRTGLRYVWSRGAALLERNRSEYRERRDVERARAAGRVVPMGLRERMAVDNTYRLLGGYRPARFDGEIVLYSADDTLPVYRHAGADRGWLRSGTAVEVVTTPGDHLTLVLAPNARSIARDLTERLAAT